MLQTRILLMSAVLLVVNVVMGLPLDTRPKSISLGRRTGNDVFFSESEVVAIVERRVYDEVPPGLDIA
ncbi:hypothetical protein FB45DRAFT_1061723 [Roridomyces roridus]|uniref:Uncharacterized protein n=1 Tax=Roridomyces roridus TaxID=1738132 RepID=A0AAD7BIM4_9AGAR|nr:hypothetical protein FB45DRAFT_1061723 [Roridomyces roridus]